MDVIRAIDAFYSDSKSKLITNHWTKLTRNRIDGVYLANKNISLLCGWDFTLLAKIGYVDLSSNRIQRVSDQTTFFGNVSVLDLSDNQVRSVNLRNTKLKALHLNHNRISSKSFASNQIRLPEEIPALRLDHNPIRKISNYAFPEGVFMNLDYCRIKLLENVLFRARQVYMEGNRGLTFKNVTFRGINYLSLEDCGIKFAEIKRLNITFIDSPDVVINCGNYTYLPLYNKSRSTFNEIKICPCIVQ